MENLPESADDAKDQKAAQREMPRLTRYGLFDEGRFISAPLQLVQVKDPDLVDIEHETELGHIVPIGDKFFWPQRVVCTGSDVTHLNRIDTKKGTFSADFYLWMRYTDGDDLPSGIEIPGFSGTFDAAHPLESGKEDGLDYRLWRASGNFKANFDLYDYLRHVKVPATGLSRTAANPGRAAPLRPRHCVGASAAG